MAGSPKACLFCGRTGQKLTGEHAYPRWLSRALIASRRVEVVYSTASGQLRRAPELDIKVREVCESCNTGWLHDLERAFRAVMIGPLQGFALVEPMPKPVQLVVAVWATKTWLLAQHGWAAMGPGASFELQPVVLRVLREHNQPPENAIVWIGALDAGPSWLAARIGTHKVVRPPNKLIGIVGVFSVGYLLFVTYLPAIAKDDPLPTETALIAFPALEPYLTKIWPHESEEVGWPPAGIFSPDDVERLWPSGHIIQLREMNWSAAHTGPPGGESPPSGGSPSPDSSSEA